MIKFKEWLQLQETGTSTADVAVFSRISIPLVRRIWPVEKDKKKRYEVPQVKD